MAQKIKQANLFGRIGTGLGQGLAEQLPKEIERNRLSSGLSAFEKESANMTPIQQMARLSSIPGITPQMIQSFGELGKQQARGQALIQGQGQAAGAQQQAPGQQVAPSPFPQQKPQASPELPQKAPSYTTEETTSRAQQGFIPRSEEQKMQAAGQKFNSNPALFGNDPQKALEYENQVDATNANIANAYQTKHQNLTSMQDNVVRRLKEQSERLNTQIPADLYSTIEDDAIQATKPKSEGGKGLTEQEAMKEYAKKMDDASKTFEKVNEIGGYGIITRPAKDTLRSMKSIQKEMEDLGQTDNYAQKLISQNNLTPMMGYSIAEPVHRIPALNESLKNLPGLERYETLVGGVVPKEISMEKTLAIAPELAKFVKENAQASPLAIAYELQNKGYDAQAWLQYVVDHSDEINLRTRQSKQAATPINTMVPINDWWLSSWTGIQ